MTLYRIAILDCNYQDSLLIKKYGTNGDIHYRYTQQFVTHKDVRLSIDIFVTIEQQLPANCRDYHAVIITGSKFSSYEELAWIPPLEVFIRHCYQANIKLFGACFGHQIIAQALGGNVEKSANGWGLGISKSYITKRKSWMQPYQNSLTLAHVHQDQVSKLPPHAVAYIHSPLAPIEGFYIADQVLTTQGHPEFSTDFLEQFLNAKQHDDIFPRTVYLAAKQSLRQRNEGAIFGQWLCHFLMDSIV